VRAKLPFGGLRSDLPDAHISEERSTPGDEEMRQHLISNLELVERLISKDGESLVDIRNGENDDGTLPFPGRSAIAALDIDARLCQQVGDFVQGPRLIFQAQNESRFFGELDFGRLQGSTGAFKIGDQQPELARACDFWSGKGLDVDPRLSQNGGHLRHHAWTALTADDQLCGRRHTNVLIARNSYHFCG
jgi:hypothetical protein